MEIDLHSAVFANENHEYMFAAFCVLFLPTANEREAIIKSSATIYPEFPLPCRNSCTLRTSILNNTPHREASSTRLPPVKKCVF